jgi:hypothetical protein
MKTSRILLAISIVLTATSFSYAGPGVQYWQQRRVDRATAPATRGMATANTPSTVEKCCRVTTVQRPIASHKVSIPVKQVECPGCSAMAAGEKCPTS